MIFNRNPALRGNTIPDPAQGTIEATLNLRQASLDDAMRYGGPITRDAISAMVFVGDRKNIVVDTKVHFLMKGFMPAIPGWHTDGVPRGTELLPAANGMPHMHAQDQHQELGISIPRYHLLVSGTHCPTRFVRDPLVIEPVDGTDLYRYMSLDVEKVSDTIAFEDTSPGEVITWDWWNIHTAQVATSRGWRYLIRVTETDYISPRTNPADFIRTQNQVYVPTEFGW